MKAIKFLLVPALSLITVFSVQAQPFNLKTYQLTVKGTSSLHDWVSSVEKMECTGSLSMSDESLTSLSDVVVKIPVKAIKSTKGKMMDSKTWEAFDHEKNPSITFKLTQARIDASGEFALASGILIMAGASRPIELKLNYKILPNGDLKVTGSHTLKMSDFKMEAPTAMMGTIKVGDEVAVAFELILTTDNKTL